MHNYHAPERTRPSRYSCNRALLRAGSLYLDVGGVGRMKRINTTVVAAITAAYLGSYPALSLTSGLPFGLAFPVGVAEPCP